MSQLDTKRDRLLELLSEYQSCAIAFSAGVDSTVLAKAAFLALGDRSVAVTANSPSLADGELDQARHLASQIGIRHVVINTNELANDQYIANQSDRCFHCKTELYTNLGRLTEELNVAVIANGANVDDRSDHRPGMRAAREHHVQSPLAECEITKDDVRALAKHWDLPVWNKAAMPCLSSRIAYGEEVTPERLRRIDDAEQWLRHRGLRDVRVRYHGGDLARIEVDHKQLFELLSETMREELLNEFTRLGFRFVTIDLRGFQSGSLNSLVPIEELEKSG